MMVEGTLRMGVRVYMWIEPCNTEERLPQSLPADPGQGEHTHSGSVVSEWQTEFIFPELLFFPRMRNLQGLESFYMPWGQRPAKEPKLTKSQRLKGARGRESVRFTALARGNTG